MIRKRGASGIQGRFKVDSMPVQDGSGRRLQGDLAGFHAGGGSLAGFMQSRAGRLWKRLDMVNA